MTVISMSFDRHLDSDVAQGLAAIGQWTPSPGVAIPLGPAVWGPDRYCATLALGPLGRRPVRLQVSSWSEKRGIHVELVPMHRVRSHRSYLRRSRVLLRDAMCAIERGPIPFRHSEDAHEDNLRHSA